jgi:hypothetical protein
LGGGFLLREITRNQQEEEITMKKSIALLMLAGVLTAVPALGADKKPADGGKNMCALFPQDCPDKVEHMTLQQMKQVLQDEIKKGSKVYSKAEMAILNQRLTNVKSLMTSLYTD